MILAILYFMHLAGIIIMVGSVAVIDVFGLVARNSRRWTRNTIEAHYITKPMIWVGAIITSLSWILLLGEIEFDGYALAKTVLLPLLLLNGAFLSFYISPILSKQRGEEKLLPKSLQLKIAVSFVVSLLLNWSFVLLTAIMWGR